MPPTKPLSDSSAKQKKIQELKAIHALLHLAHHRNHNQHRRSKWWKDLSMLRRGVAGLVGVLEKGMGMGRVGNGDERMRFLGREVIPRCWVAFSTVVADNQYAPLGLMLLGTLARLGRVIGLEMIEDERNSVESEVIEDQEAMVDVEAAGIDWNLSSGGTGIGHSTEDMGVAVRREDVEVEGRSGPREAKSGGRPIGKHARQVEVEEIMATMEAGTPTPVARRKKKKKRDAIDELFKGLV